MIMAKLRTRSMIATPLSRFNSPTAASRAGLSVVEAEELVADVGLAALVHDQEGLRGGEDTIRSGQKQMKGKGRNSQIWDRQRASGPVRSLKKKRLR